MATYVVRDNKSKAIFGRVVPQKGLDEKGLSVDSLVEDVKWLGYTRVTLKSDNEPAIVKLLSEALRELRINGVSQVLEEHSPEYDPRSNGSAEVGVKLLKNHLRTIRSNLENEIGHRIPVRPPWSREWSAMRQRYGVPRAMTAARHTNE